MVALNSDTLKTGKNRDSEAICLAWLVILMSSLSVILSEYDLGRLLAEVLDLYPHVGLYMNVSPHMEANIYTCIHMRQIDTSNKPHNVSNLGIFPRLLSTSFIIVC